MIYKGPGFLAVVCLAPPRPVSELDLRQTGRLRMRDTLQTGEGEKGEWGGRNRIIRPQESLVLYSRSQVVVVHSQTRSTERGEGRECSTVY